MTAIESSIIMLPVSIVLAMVFRNIQQRPTEQRLIKDLLVYDEDNTYADLVTMYEERKIDIDKDTYKSLSEESLPIQDMPDEGAGDGDDVDKQSTSSSSSSSSSDSSEPPAEDEFVTPKEVTQTPTPAGETSARPDMTVDRHSEFSTAIESDIDTYVGPLPWWVDIIAWIFAIVASVACGFFIILYTFTFGYEDSKAWCVSVLTSFFIGLLLEQPVKILLVAFALAFICRKATDIYPSELDIVADHSTRGM